MTQQKHIHLIGICGTAMASLAGMLRAHGHRVTGSDTAAYPPMSDQLRAQGIPILEPYSAANLAARARPRRRRQRHLPRQSRARIRPRPLAHPHDLAWPRSSTTSSSPTASASLSAAPTARPPPPACSPGSTKSPAAPTRASRRRFLIGGVAENFGTSFHVTPTSRTFILEGDEYDTAFFDKGPKFLHYFPDAAILTHVEFDHADIYADLDAVKTAFKRIVNLIPQRGRLIAYDGNPNVTECCAKAFCNVERYGLSPRLLLASHQPQAAGKHHHLDPPSRRRRASPA